jgi:type VI secretion system protein ImpG
MDPRFLQYYERELRYLRELGAEFAQQFPKIAGRLGLSDHECTDPHVERLIEAFGFMAARVQLKLDAEFPRFTQHLMELIYPHYLAPTPSMAVVQFTPNPREGGLANGFVLPRETVLRTRRGPRELTACEYRTKHAVTLWPLEIEHAEYTSVLHALSDVQLPGLSRAKALLRIRLRTTAGLRFDQLSLDTLPLFLRGADETAFRLYEQLISRTLAVVVRPASAETDRQASNATHARHSVRALGFTADEALLPYCARSFHGYRLLHEYFALPSRFAFVELAGLAEGVRRCNSDRLDILIALDRLEPTLESSVDAARLVPFAAPAINLFPRACDRIQLSERNHEVHLVPDRTRPLDLELHTISQVAAYAPGVDGQREFLPLYSARARLDTQRRPAYYTLERRPRVLSSQRRVFGSRTGYTGSEAFLTLVDGDDGSHASELRQLGVTALCTNRDLPLLLTLGQADDFVLQTAAPVVGARCVAGPSAPRSSPLDGAVAWRLVSHLSLNYLSLCDAGNRPGSEALREMLALYAELGDPGLRTQVEGLSSVASQSVTRPLPGPGAPGFGRGIEITLECDERAFAGGGSFAFASVLAHFFAKYASINSFTETVLRTRERGEVFRWPTTLGLRHAL